MAKFNVKTPPKTPSSPITSTASPTVLTHEGAPGYVRDAKGELFLLAVSNMVGEDTFYEKAAARDARYTSLIHQVAVQDPAWMAKFLPWLRGEGNMRSAPLVGALEAAHAMLKHQIPGARQLVASVLQRADEPGEAIGYWHKVHGRSIPKPVKRGIADAADRLYHQRSALKYDTKDTAIRFGDVIDLTHPTPGTIDQGVLFRWLLNRRHNRPDETPAVLSMVRNREQLARAVAAGRREALLDARNLEAAGVTWEALAGMLQGPMDAAAWSAVIPSMGYMALLRNLRNFDEAGVPDDVAAGVAARLADPEQVARSRQFPYRFLAAYENAPSVRWSHPLDKALDLCLRNLPKLSGRSLVLIDTSASMTGGSFSAKSKMTPAKAAAVFGVALAAGCGADLFGFADGQFRHEVPKGGSVIREVDRFVKRTGEVGHGTYIAQAVRATYRGHERVFIISDMQTMDAEVSNAVPAGTALYGFNLGGYRPAAMATGQGNRHEFGGLTDATFRMVPLLEAGRDGAWPWEC